MDGPRLDMNNRNGKTTAEASLPVPPENHSPSTEMEELPIPSEPSELDALPGPSRLSKPWTPPAGSISKPVPSPIVLGSKPSLSPITLASVSKPAEEPLAKRPRLENDENIPPENEVILWEGNVPVVQQHQSLIRPSTPPGNNKALRIMKLIENQQIIEAKKLEQHSESANLVSKLMDNLQYLRDGN